MATNARIILMVRVNDFVETNRTFPVLPHDRYVFLNSDILDSSIPIYAKSYQDLSNNTSERIFPLINSTNNRQTS
jgi:hypothetical protein